jgi:phospholipase/carboxylesterase
MSPEQLQAMPPLFMAHGTADDLIKKEAAEDTFEQLKQLGIKGSMHLHDGLTHDMNVEEILQLEKWIASIFTSK